MDNSKSLVESVQIIRSRKELIEINLDKDEEFIELNLIDLPFIYFYKNNSKESVIATIKYSWITSDNISRAIEVKTSDMGIPDSYDFDVLVSLFNIYVKNQHNNTIKCVKEKNLNQLALLDDYFETIDNTVNFTFVELAKEMGYSAFSSHIKNKLEKSIQKLVSTTIFNSAEGGLYDPLSKTYITDSKFSINILSDYRTFSYQDVIDKNGNKKRIIDRKNKKDKSSIKIDKFFLRNLLIGKGKLSNKKLRTSLKGDVAKRLYLLLNKWQNNRQKAYYSFETLYQRIPLAATKSDYYRKRRVLDAVKELKEVGFISEFETDKTGVNLYFSKKSNQNKKQEENLLDKYNTIDEIQEGFKKYKVPDSLFNKHFKLHKVSYYQALLRFVDDRIKKIKSPESYILKGLVDMYDNIDERYYNK